MKFLSVNNINDPGQYNAGAANLVVEAKFLASLGHLQDLGGKKWSTLQYHQSWN